MARIWSEESKLARWLEVELAALEAQAELGVVRELIRYGRHVSASNVLNIVNNTADNVVIGRVLGATMLGFYAVAFRLADFPNTVIAHIVGRLQVARSDAGVTLTRIDGVNDRLDGQKLAAETEKSNAEDLDMAQAISDFQNKQSGYDAALKSYSMVQHLSLFQYLNA